MKGCVNIMIALIIMIIFIILVAWGITVNNKLVRYKNEVEVSESQITIQLQRRADLIPNLVNTVKGYSTHEQDTLTKVAEMRKQLVNPNDNLNEKLAINDELSSELHQLIISVENYPELKANENFLRLQEELTNTENKVAYSRASFNNTTGAFNTMVESFPTSIIASMKKYKTKELIKTNRNEEIEDVPEIKF